MQRKRPTWIAQIPARVFPRGPRAFYCYLCAFKSGTCFLFNYRLAAKFYVSIRTIQRWRSWLTRHKLIHTWYLDPKRPRINVHHFRSFRHWLSAMALPKTPRGIPNPKLSLAQKNERIRKMKAQLLGF